MGCDIRCIAEIKVDGQWHLIDQIQIGRDYDLFGFMAQVRTLPSGSIPARGLPKDISVMGLYLYDFHKDDHHSASWLAPTEIEQAIEKYRDAFGQYRPWLLGSSYTEFLDDPDVAPGIEDVRWVFWFKS